MDARPMEMSGRPGNWVAKLHRFVRGPSVAGAEYCEMCAAPIASDHQHLAEPAKGRLLCVCQGCALLLGNREDKYRLVPKDARTLEDFRMTDGAWEALAIPIGLAFFFHSTAEDRVVAFYPGPAGPTESLLDLATWSQLVSDNPLLAEFEPDVEALLVNRVNGAREYFRVPIDRCYSLVGLIRTHWHGISGGSDAWTAIDGFFTDLRGLHRASGSRRHG